MERETERNAEPVGRRARRAQDAYFSAVVERAGFEPGSAAVFAQGVRGLNVLFALTQGGIRTSSRGSNPARLASSVCRNRGRAEIFALPFFGSRLIAAP